MNENIEVHIVWQARHTKLYTSVLIFYFFYFYLFIFFFFFFFFFSFLSQWNEKNQLSIPYNFYLYHAFSRILIGERNKFNVSMK